MRGVTSSAKYNVSDEMMRSNGGCRIEFRFSRPAFNGKSRCCEAITLGLFHNQLSGGTVQSRTRTSIAPDPGGRLGRLRDMLGERTAETTSWRSVAITSQPMDAKASLRMVRGKRAGWRTYVGGRRKAKRRSWHARGETDAAS
ncbi:hypothetical protein GSI_13862 [Ganoderma sinense ZZ0214-1]|uniref:Uncharacterized protein n=1 Tax=Ganoderma sinense ZZ0214-1 TaxID=1077348 RepID=A0A2G8RRH4_9APHY|nr:hypothetical protein GSI_13862 [Ganoderma sinense ZZ0214-1]